MSCLIRKQERPEDSQQLGSLLVLDKVSTQLARKLPEWNVASSVSRKHA